MKDNERLARLNRLSPAKRALLMEKLREEGRQRKGTGIGRYERNGPIPQTFAQQRLWFLDRLQPGGSFYNMPECARLEGRLDLDRFNRCFNDIIRRHESLRTTFGMHDGLPVQIIAPELELAIELIDVESLPWEEREPEARRLLFVESEHAFDLINGPLVRMTLIRLAEEHHFLLINMHHIISDGWSTGIFIHELTTLYEAYMSNRPATLPELPVQYADFAFWQREWLHGDRFDEQLSYWVERLARTPMLELPLDRPRPPVQSFRGGFQSLLLPIPLARGLERLALAEGASLFMVLLAAFKTLLYRYSGQTDISAGVPIAGRVRPELETLIGFFANTVVMRTDLGGDPTFRDVIRREREVALGAYAHQEMPFERVVEELQPERNLSFNPIFQLMFILQNTRIPVLELPGLRFELLAAGTLSVKFDILFELYETREGIQGWMGYSSELFEPETMQRMARDYRTLLEAVVDDPDTEISTIRIGSAGAELAAGFDDDLEML
ncbi:MAG TPA: condensation domain-containing protein [Candidatus Kapabacteria bacterium]|nr:condensation domain-containing protein [Candidatus Kapabacteria bacterium]